MGKITRQSEATHVTDRVFAPDAPGDSPVVDLTEYDAGPRGGSEGQTGNENTPVQRADEVRHDGAEEVGGGRQRVADDGGDVVVEDPALSPGDDPAPDQEARFEATGEADVVAGEQPPVEKSIDDVKSWVGDDYVKAERALEAERAGKNRASLVQWLEKVAVTR